MVRQYKNFNIKKSDQGSIILIGNFDGIHLGHQKLFKLAQFYKKKYKAKIGVINFDPLPKMFFNKYLQNFRITSTSQKIKLLGSLNVDFVITKKFDKKFSKSKAFNFIKEILYKNHIRTPKWLGVSFSKQILKNGLDASSFDKFKPFDYLFLKPQEDGSSIDIFKISDNESLKDAYQKCVKPERDFLFEEYISGREITVTIINKKCFPPIEIITNNDFYDYDAKYISDNTLHKEAELSEIELKEIETISLNAFEALDCKGWGRVDLLQDERGNFYVSL